MTRLAYQCTACEKALEGNTDTFGWPGNFCWNCYAELNCNGGCLEGGSYYGLAPHHHDLTLTGHMIGSTVFDPLPEPNAVADAGRSTAAVGTGSGEYIIDNMTFSPDPLAPGMGVWEYRALPGWR